MLRRKKEETLRSLVAGSLLTRLLTGPEVHRGAGYGSRLPINKMIKLPPAHGSSWSTANPAMLACGDLGNRQRGLWKSIPSRYIPRMPKRKRETEWEVIRLKATPAAFVGLVRAPDKASALKTAIKRFNIRREDQSRLLVRPR